MSEILQSQEIVKLYEYELYKPELCESFLEHQGILGMHWGRRNGPPYPLDSKVSTGSRLKKTLGDIRRKHKKKAAIKKARKTRLKNLQEKKKQEQLKKQQEKIQQEKDKIIQNNDIQTMFKNVGQFTNEEINRVLTRLDTEKKLKERVAELERANMPKFKRFRKKLAQDVKEGAASGLSSMARTGAKNAVKLGLRTGLKSLASDDEDVFFNKKLVDQLFREEKKKR